jgi:hypothetical protein
VSRMAARANAWNQSYTLKIRLNDSSKDPVVNKHTSIDDSSIIGNRGQQKKNSLVSHTRQKNWGVNVGKSAFPYSPIH